MSKRVVYLTDEQWRKIEPLIPKKPIRRKGGGGAPSGRCSVGLRGDTVDIENGGQMERSSRPVSESLDVLVSPERMV